MRSTSSATSPATSDAQVVDLAAADVARKLRALESHIDAAWAAGGELQSAIVRARLAHGLSATVGQPIFAAVGQVTVALADARGHAVKGHRLLEPLARSLGIDIRAFGEERKDDGDSTSTGNG